MRARVVIPKSPMELIKLGKEVCRKHSFLGKNYPLGVLPWEIAGPAIDKAMEQHKLAEKLRRDMEKAYSKRDKNLLVIKDILRRSRDLLKGVYGREMKKLGDFGFTVDSTPRKKKR